jgi:nucleoside-diphosphate-sugar epimerase
MQGCSGRVAVTSRSIASKATRRLDAGQLVEIEIDNRLQCLTGSAGHAGTKSHGFLAYLAKCAVTGEPYTVLGYKGNQVRDNIHSYDLVDAFWHFTQAPRPGAVYNIGGGRYADCSMLEAIAACERHTGNPVNWSYSDQRTTKPTITPMTNVAVAPQSVHVSHACSE